MVLNETVLEVETLYVDKMGKTIFVPTFHLVTKNSLFSVKGVSELKGFLCRKREREEGERGRGERKVPGGDYGSAST